MKNYTLIYGTDLAWYATLAMLIFLSFYAVAIAHSISDGIDYYARSNEAHGNESHLALYNSHRGDLVTVSGRAESNTVDVDPPSPYVSLRLDDMDDTVDLIGHRVFVCRGDEVAASGTYHYAAWGGTIEIKDVRNVSVLRDAWRLAAFRSLFPRACWL
jgi:hypothetical protein